MIYIYHNIETDEYYPFNNLSRLSAGTGLSYDTVCDWFIRRKLERVEKDNYKVIKAELVKRKGSKPKTKKQ